MTVPKDAEAEVLGLGIGLVTRVSILVPLSERIY